MIRAYPSLDANLERIAPPFRREVSSVAIVLYFFSMIERISDEFEATTFAYVYIYIYFFFNLFPFILKILLGISNHRYDKNFEDFFFFESTDFALFLNNKIGTQSSSKYMLGEALLLSRSRSFREYENQYP